MSSIAKARAGEMTQQEFIKTNVGRAIGAIFLIIPGFLTDMVGILMLIGILPLLITKLFHFKQPNQTNGFPSDFNAKQTNFNNTTYKGSINDEIIDVEVIDDNKPLK